MNDNTFSSIGIRSGSQLEQPTGDQAIPGDARKPAGHSENHGDAKPGRHEGRKDFKDEQEAESDYSRISGSFAKEPVSEHDDRDCDAGYLCEKEPNERTRRVALRLSQHSLPCRGVVKQLA